jgi:hypothetical protein
LEEDIARHCRVHVDCRSAGPGDYIFCYLETEWESEGEGEKEKEKKKVLVLECAGFADYRHKIPFNSQSTLPLLKPL